jgi:2-polyprenyl-6-hydroxyphenyl methylase/3-demethylubiquinone-9 3-methyltransferase
MTRRNDLELYEEHAWSWWTGRSRFFRSLRSVGAFHLGLIEREWGDDLAGARIADLGCGGGTMALALEERGAHVTGIDRSPKSIAAAHSQARCRGLSSEFLCGDLCRTPLPAQQFDFVVMSDVLEHLETPDLALSEAGRLLRPGGRLFVNTFDRSRASAIVVVHVAEGLGLVPRGTHDARLFVRPEELVEYARSAGLRRERLVWERPALLRSALTWTVHLRAARGGFGFSTFFTKEVG